MLHINPEQVHLIRKSFAELARHDHVAALVFYKRLFELDPSLKGLFSNDIEEQSRKLLDMLEGTSGKAFTPAMKEAWTTADV